MTYRVRYNRVINDAGFVVAGPFKHNIYAWAWIDAAEGRLPITDDDRLRHIFNEYHDGPGPGAAGGLSSEVRPMTLVAGWESDVEKSPVVVAPKE